MVRSGADSGVPQPVGLSSEQEGFVVVPSAVGWTTRRRRFACEVAGVGVAVVMICWELLGRLVLDQPMTWWVFPLVALLLGVLGSVTTPGQETLTDHAQARVYAIGIAMLAPPVLIAVEHFALSRTDAETTLAIASAAFVIYLLVMAWVHGGLRQLEIQASALGELASVDHLTGLLNRRSADDALQRLMGSARHPSTTAICVAMMDLDHFKRFNDTHGHAEGDRLLAEAATAWSARLATSDVLTRYGGEEFLLICRRGSSDALALVNRMRSDTPSDQTFSAGIAEWDGRESAAHLVARADKALYEAKEAGRRRSVLAAQPATGRRVTSLTRARTGAG